MYTLKAQKRFVCDHVGKATWLFHIVKTHAYYINAHFCMTQLQLCVSNRILHAMHTVYAESGGRDNRRAKHFALPNT